MDIGCYSIHQLRTLAGAEPAVTGARAKLIAPGVDRWMRADFEFADGRTGRVTCGLLAAAIPIVDIRVRGDEGDLKVLFPNRPGLFKHLVVRRRAGGTTREPVPVGSSYAHQLEAFCTAVLQGGPVLTPPADSIANMRVIDAVYEAAGLDPREPSE
jgi:predicted dehydrogenase